MKYSMAAMRWLVYYTAAYYDDVRDGDVFFFRVNYFCREKIAHKFSLGNL
jgi:hypothetical protein